MNIREILAKATEIVIRKEAKDLGELTTEAEHAFRVNSPVAKDLGQKMQREVDRLDNTVVFDHEAVFEATGQYTTGRGDGSSPKVDRI